MCFLSQRLPAHVPTDGGRLPCIQGRVVLCVWPTGWGWVGVGGCVRAKKIYVAKMDVQFLTLYSKFHFPREDMFLVLGGVGVLAWGGLRQITPPPSPPPVDMHIPHPRLIVCQLRYASDASVPPQLPQSAAAYSHATPTSPSQYKCCRPKPTSTLPVPRTAHIPIAASCTCTTAVHSHTPATCICSCERCWDGG